jgi:CRP-like cAMP-binding protein
MWDMGRPVDLVDLQVALARHSENAFTPRSTVLFRRGDPAFGVFIIHRGTVGLDFGVDSALVQPYGTGALVGLPATLARRPYSMTATVLQDAELGFLRPEALDALFRTHPELCQRMLIILGDKLAETQRAQKALLSRDLQPARQMNIV